MRDRVGQLDAVLCVERGEASASAAATIAVSGERRSCETERRTAVLISSLRRSALVSTTSRVSALALERGAPAAPSSAGATRSRATLGGRDGHEQRAEVAERDRRVPLVALDALEHDGGRVDLERVGDPLGGRCQRRVRLRAAEQQLRELGGQVGLAPAPLGLAGARARPASDSVDATTAATRNTTSATQFSASAIVNRPVGGMWKKLNASAAATLVARPSHSPQSVETSRTASRYRTPSETGSAISSSGYSSSVVSASEPTATTTPSAVERPAVIKPLARARERE